MMLSPQEVEKIAAGYLDGLGVNYKIENIVPWSISEEKQEKRVRIKARMILDKIGDQLTHLTQEQVETKIRKAQISDCWIIAWTKHGRNEISAFRIVDKTGEVVL